jgi:hypothetical protein
VWFSSECRMADGSPHPRTSPAVQLLNAARVWKDVALVTVVRKDVALVTRADAFLRPARAGRDRGARPQFTLPVPAMTLAAIDRLVTRRSSK